VKSDGVHTIRMRIVDVVVVVLETNMSTMLFKKHRIFSPQHLLRQNYVSIN